jgi:precorrin-3B synthase
VIRDACPSVHEPFAQLDGALVRIRVPGGLFSARNLRRVSEAASAFGTGLEITSRANLQIRGVSTGAHGRLVQDLVGVGVTLADAAADARRNVLASPTAGVDPLEVVDTRPLTTEVVDALAATEGPGLSPKFGVLVDGGGAVHVRGRRQDLCLGAVRLTSGSWGYEVRLAEPLPEHPEPQPTWVVGPEAAGALVEGVLELMAEHEDAGGRISELVARWGSGPVLRRAAARRGVDLFEVAHSGLGLPSRPSLRPIGELPQHQPGYAVVGAMPVLGRLSAGQLGAIADVAEEFCGGGDDPEVRLTPWRSVVIPNVPSERATAALDELHRLGLAVDPMDPALSVVACAGSTGCPSSFTDTQGDGRALVEALRAARPTSRFMVHLSGCPKRCADRATEFDVTLVGGPTHGIYGVVVGPGLREPEGIIRSPLGAEAARASARWVAGSDGT